MTKKTIEQGVAELKSLAREDLLKQARKAIICALHPGMTYEEALEKEFGFGCKVRANFYHYGSEKPKVEEATITHDNGRWKRTAEWDDCTDEIVEILGIPISLARTLFAISYAGYPPYAVSPSICGKIADVFVREHFFEWRPADDSGKELFLEDQSDETLIELIEIFNQK